jgi:hypothetical protein
VSNISKDRLKNCSLLEQRMFDLKTVLVNGYSLNSHHALSNICELLEPQKLNSYQYGWACISAIGDFELFDYERGLVFVSITVETSPKKGKGCCRVHIGNVDDGEWQARSELISLEKAQLLTDKVAETLFMDEYREKMTSLRILPSAKDLNKKLEPFGMVGEFS